MEGKKAGLAIGIFSFSFPLKRFKKMNSYNQDLTSTTTRKTALLF